MKKEKNFQEKKHFKYQIHPKRLNYVSTVHTFKSSPIQYLILEIYDLKIKSVIIFSQ